MRTGRRPMTARERAELGAIVSRSTTSLRAVLFVAAVASFGWLLRGLQWAITETVGAGSEVPIWFFVTGAFGIWLFKRSKRWTGGRELREKVSEDLRQGEMAVHYVRVADALEAPEVEDEGPVYFIREEGGQTLFFAGQEMARHKARGFPWREFEAAEAPRSKHLFRLKPRSGSFSGVRERPPLSFEEARGLGVFDAPFGVLDVSLADLERPGQVPAEEG